MATGSYSVDPEFAHILNQTTGQATHLRRFMSDLSAGKEVRIKNSNRDMEPWIKFGDVMVFGPSNLDNTRPGDIVLYRLRESAVPRRVVRKTIVNGEAVLLTKADSRPELDPPVKVANVFGRLVSVERGTRTIKASSLTRGVVDVLTDYGSRSMGAKLVDFLLAFIPSSIRPKRA